MSSNALVQFIIYDHPKDFPNSFVVRRWIIGPGTVTPGAAVLFATLANARRAIPPGLVLLARSEDDDPCIVEVWT